MKFAPEQEKHSGEYSSFFKPSMWNYLHVHLDWMKSIIVSKRLCNKMTDNLATKLHKTMQEKLNSTLLVPKNSKISSLSTS